MGTSNAYAGSGGQWVGVADALDDWLDSLPYAPPDNGEAPEQPADQPNADNHKPDNQPDAPALDPVLKPLSRILLSGSRGSADGPGTGGGIGTRPAKPPGGQSPSGTGRPRARVGRVGGRLVAGLGGLLSRDADALAELGLDLDELRTLDPYRQAQRLLDAATEDSIAETLEEDELRTAANRVAIWALGMDPPPSVEDLVRRFVAEYIYEVFLTEEGARIKSDTRNSTDARRAEQRVRDTINALVRQVQVQPAGLTATALADTVEDVYVKVLRIHAGDDE